MRITASARRHGVSDEGIGHAVAHAIRIIEADDGLFLVGADASGQLLVFHAMALRPAKARRYLR